MSLSNGSGKLQDCFNRDRPIIMSQQPTLIFAHANGLPGASYKTFLAPFSKEADVHVVDRLGHSPQWRVNNGWSNLVDELEAFYQPFKKPVIGVGHSLGAVVTFALARRHPDWFSAVVMLDPPLVNGWPSVLFRFGMAIGLSDKLTPAGLSKNRRDHWPSWDEVEGYFSRRGFFQRFDPRCLEDYLSAGIVADAKEGFTLKFKREVEVAVFRSGPPSTMGKPKLKVPALLVSGETSEKFFHQAAQRHCKHHGMAHQFAPGSHMFPLEKPDEAYQLINTWLVQQGVLQ